MFVSLISGSSGNASVISDGTTYILTDCGMSGKKLSETLASLDLSCTDLTCVLLTHEHTDHSRGIGVLARRYHLPVYATEDTFAALSVGDIPDGLFHPVKPGEDFSVGGIGIKPFSILHDAADPVGYTFTTKDSRYAIATDTGEMNEDIFSAISGCDSVLLESNHDVDMLMYGSYPYPLKKRILGRFGHLSNADASKTAVQLLEQGTKKIMLGHLSKENNTPEIAYETTKNALTSAGARLSEDIALGVAGRYEITILD